MCNSSYVFAQDPESQFALMAGNKKNIKFVIRKLIKQGRLPGRIKERSFVFISDQRCISSKFDGVIRRAQEKLKQGKCKVAFFELCRCGKYVFPEYFN